MDQLSAMRVFCRVVETGSFTRAADALDMPKSTVGKQIGQLEAHLRIKLLKRTTRTVRVTSEGAAYYERISDLLRQLDDIDSAFDQERGGPRGRVVVDASAWVASTILSPALPRFYERYPDIQIELGVSDRTIHLMRENVDCVIRGGRLNDQGLIGRLLGESPWITAASPAYLRRYGTPATPEDLASGHFLLAHQLAVGGRTVPFRFERDGAEFTNYGPWRLSVNESNAHLAAGLAGLGILQSFEWKLRPALRAGDLVPILGEWTRAVYPIHVLYPPTQFMNLRLRVFIDWLVEVFAELQSGHRADGHE